MKDGRHPPAAPAHRIGATTWPGEEAGPPVHDDLVARQFTALAADRTWLTGITEHPTGEGKLYLCAIKDVYSNRIVGYSMGSRMTANLAVSALHNAIALRSPAGTVNIVLPWDGAGTRNLPAPAPSGPERIATPGSQSSPTSPNCPVPALGAGEDRNY